MALLILWEVQHGRTFPAAVDGDNVAARLSSFSRRLHDRLMRDDVLRDTLEVREMQFPLAPALPASHQLRWAVQVRRPEGEEQAGWYHTFVERWQAYLRTLVTTARGRQGADPSEERPRKRTRAPPPSRPPPAPAPSAARRAAPVRDRSPAAGREPSAKRSRGSLAGWLQPRGGSTTTPVAAGGSDTAVSSGHGRATSSPPT